MLRRDLARIYKVLIKICLKKALLYGRAISMYFKGTSFSRAGALSDG
jgi:hypothetical protein